MIESLVRRVGKLQHADKRRPIVVLEHDLEHDVCLVVVGTSQDRSSYEGAVVVDNPSHWKQLGLNGRTVYLSLYLVASERIELLGKNRCPAGLFLDLTDAANSRIRTVLS